MEWDEIFPDETPSKETPPSEPVSLSFAAKFAFWFCVWVGTAIAGATLGLFFGVCGALMEGDLGVLVGAVLLGLCWAGGIGAFLMIHIATFKWMFGIDCSPKLLAGIAGALTGLTAFCLFFLSVPLGIFGAVVGTNLFLQTGLGSEILRYESYRLDPANQKSKKSFTLMDLMLRMTAISVLLAFWTLLLNQ